MEDITNRLADMALVPSPMRKPPPAKKARLERGAPVQPKKHWSLEDFEVGPKIGEGRFGRVHPARVRGSNLIYCMKVMQLNKIAPALLERELTVHRELRHPHIVRLLTWFNDDTNIYIVLEWCNGGTVHELMSRYRHRGFPQELAAKYTAQLVEAIHHLHSQNPPVLHRDVKPENTFLDVHGNLKLGDFGWAVPMETARRTVCGTFDYFAPELCVKSSYGKELDTWTVGVFAFEMCYGRAPFQIPAGASQADLFMKIREAPLQFPAEPQVDPSAKDFMRRLMEKKPEKRMALEEALSHPWLQKYYYSQRRH